MAFNNTIVARVAAAVWGLKLGYATTQAALTQANMSAGGLNSVINGAFNDSYAGVSNAAISATVVSNLGLTGVAATQGTAYLVDQLSRTPAAERGAKISEVVALFASLGADPTYGAAATAFNNKVAAATVYSSTVGTQDAVLGFLASGTSFFLTLGQDNLTGTGADDAFTAYVFDNSNSLQSADRLDGGAGNDTLFADMGSSQNFAVTPITTNIENIVIRAESEATAQGQNNVGGTGRVQIDAERINGATRFESNNSRSDVIIEDVRILPNQITSDITIAFVESDPGHVDFGVYFDQLSLRNTTSNTSAINLRIMDTVAAAAGLAPLLNSNYGAFTFAYTAPGATGAQSVTLGSPATEAIQNAQTYVQLAAAFQAELDRVFGAGVATATIGDNFTVIDPASNRSVTGQTIVLSTKTAIVFDVSLPTAGWLAQGTAPPLSNFFTDFRLGATSATSLVTSKVILDDVGRGSTSGDLVIGGLSTGVTSSSLGVQRFEIEVRDNSKMESIKSTNNTLREVTIVNGVTTSSSFAYGVTVKDAGNLTVNGNSGLNGGNITQVSPNGSPAVDAQTGTNAPLPNTGPATNYGFTDVRLIDATTLRGKLEFSAEITSAVIPKYLNLKDIQALPAGDNIAFTYTGGVNDDKMYVSIDSLAVSSRSTIVSGREDFTFTANGGTGNDEITVFVSPSTTNLGGGLQAWYTNQKLNRNITINGGDGNDTIRKPGAGDVIINGGAGLDTIYADNSGAQGAQAGTDSLAGAAYAAASAAELNSALAVATLATGTNAGTATANAAALNTLNLVTPVSFTDPAVPANPNPALPTKAALTTAIDNAAAALALTPAQQIALYVAYNTRTGDTVSQPTTLVPPAPTGGAPVAGALTAAEFAAGNALLDTYIAAAKAAAAAATAADSNVATQNALLNATQLAVLTNTLLVNGVTPATPGNPGPGVPGGTAVNLANLSSLNSSLILGATDVQVVAAIQAANANGSLAAAGLTQAQVFNAATSAGAGTIDAAEVTALQAIFVPALNSLTNTNANATAALAAAITANNTAIRTASNIVGADPVLATASAVPNDAVGSAEAAAAVTAATAALNAFNNGAAATALGIQTGLAALKSALAVGVSDLAYTILTTNAVNDGVITGGDKVTLDGYATAVNTTLTAAEKANQVDVYITALQVTNDITVANNANVTANLAANVTATTFASAQAAAAATAAPIITGTNPFLTYDKGVYVLNTANQANVTTTPGTGYVLAVNDERNIADLKSGANESYNFFNTTLTVTFKGIEATVSVPSTNFRTSDLQVNQAIKDAINNNLVLNKLLVAEDGPANSLVVSSLIDGVLSVANFGIVVTLPTALSLSTTDISGAATAYGVTATDVSVLGAMTVAKATFDTKGDYVDQLAETGSFGGNVNITGSASVTTSDNTITPGDGNDVIVLGTTVGSDALTSSNDRVVYSGNWGDDTIVYFRAGSLATGGDILGLGAVGGTLLGTSFSTDRSVNVVAEAAGVNSSAALVAALFTDSATAQTHVYVAYDAVTNIGKVYAVVDAAGVGTSSVTATLAGTIDLADTLWSTLTAENFG